MLGKIQMSGVVRAAIAACLAILLSSASLVQLSASSFSGSSNSCGRSQGKCCCRKNAHATPGPAVSSKSCESDCCQVTLGGTAANGFVQPSTRVVAPQAAFLSRVCEGEPATEARLSGYSLQQRPPPTFPIA